MSNLIKGTGNVFADMGEPEAELKNGKAALAASLIRKMDKIGLDSKALKDLRLVRQADLAGLTPERMGDLLRIMEAIEEEHD